MATAKNATVTVIQRMSCIKLLKADFDYHYSIIFALVQECARAVTHPLPFIENERA